MLSKTFKYILVVIAMVFTVGCGPDHHKNDNPDVPALDHDLVLDGVDDRAEADTSIFPNSTTVHSFTVEAWIYPTAAGSYIATDDAYDLILYYDPNPGVANNGVGITFKLYNLCNSSIARTEYRDVKLNQWNHVAGMYDASAKQFWLSINGNLSSSPGDFPADTFCNDSNFHFTVGGFYGSNDETFQGSIDEFRVSDNVRYDIDFTPLNSFTPDTNTKGLWDFDESPGSTSFFDSSGNGNTLTGVNGAQNN